MAEWLRRWTANPMGSARVGSNPILVDNYFNPYLPILVCFKDICVSKQMSDESKENISWALLQNEFRYRESNPGHLGESQIS